MNSEKEKEGAREGKRKVREKNPSYLFTFIKAQAPMVIFIFKATKTSHRGTERACFGHHK